MGGVDNGIKVINSHLNLNKEMISILVKIQMYILEERAKRIISVVFGELELRVYWSSKICLQIL